MRKRIFLTILVAALFVFLLAVAVGAAAIYKDTDGNTLLELEFYTAEDGVDSSYTSKKVVKSYVEYNGGLAKFDSEGNHLTWYLTDTTNYANGDVEHTVAFFKTVGEDESATVRGVVSNGKYSYVGVDAKRIVSANFPDNSGITSFAAAYGGYNTYNSTNLLFFYGPNTLSSMDEGIFQDTPVIIAELDEDTNITYIGKKICHEARNLRSFTIPSKVTRLMGNSPTQGATFYNCVSLERVTFGANSQFEKTGNYDFYNCNKLREIALPDNGKNITIGSEVFRYCYALGEGVIPDNVVSIGNLAFANSGLSGSLFSENSRCSYIGSDCFKETKITSLTVPSALTSILQNTFLNCTVLEHVSFAEPSGLTSIGQSAFSGCSSISFVAIPNGVTSIGNNAFYGCSSLNSLTLTDNLVSIGTSCFEGTAITSLRIPSQLTEIPNKAFYNCSKLKAIEFSDSVLTIGDYSFYGCSSVTELVLPDTVTSLGGGCFSNCSSIKAFKVPLGVTVLNSRLLSGCSSLEDVQIHNNVTTIGVRVFEGCGRLNTVNFGASLNTVLSEGDHHSLTYRAGIKNVYLPATFTADSLPSTGKLTYMFTNSSTVFYYAGTQEQFDAIVSKLKGLEGNAAFSTVPTVENGRLVFITPCEGFYNNEHTGSETLVYENGFASSGKYTIECTRCNEIITESLGNLITPLGYSTYQTMGDRLRVASGYNVDTELVDIYERINDVELEIGVIFSSKVGVELFEDVPQSIASFAYYSDYQRTYSQYNYIIEFPSPETDNDHYVAYKDLWFVVSAFVNETHRYDAGHVYTYYQTDDRYIGETANGFYYTSISTILGQ